MPNYPVGLQRSSSPRTYAGVHGSARAMSVALVGQWMPEQVRHDGWFPSPQTLDAAAPSSPQFLRIGGQRTTQVRHGQGDMFLDPRATDPELGRDLFVRQAVELVQPEGAARGGAGSGVD